MTVTLARGDAFLRELAGRDLVTAGRAAFPTNRVSPEMKADLRQRLGSFVQDPTVELRARIDAGMVLDTPEPLGFERHRNSEGTEYLWPPTGVVPAVAYQIGSKDGDDRANEDEPPKHVYRMQEDLRVARHPVTNAEYARFMAAGGYEDERWWPEGESRAWWKGERKDTQAEYRASALRDWSSAKFERIAAERGWNEDIRSAYRTYRELREGLLKDAIAYLQPAVHPATLKQPKYWRNRDFNRPLQPVVGLCVFEAEAYALWLSNASGYRARLLAERAWEAAARGLKHRKWSYGSTMDALVANTLDLRLRRTSPAGVFAGTATRERIEDLSGNVWEWKASPWTQDHQAITPLNCALRVVRGGSWNVLMDDAHDAYRFTYPRDGRLSDLGFRLFFPFPN